MFQGDVNQFSSKPLGSIIRWPKTDFSQLKFEVLLNLDTIIMGHRQPRTIENTFEKPGQQINK